MDNKVPYNKWNNTKHSFFNIFLKAFAVTFCLFIFILIVSSMSLIYKLVVLNEDIKTIAGFNLYKVTNEDLTLKLDKGDLIIVRKINKNELSEGDIVTFSNGSSISTHKVDSILSDGIIINKNDKGYEDKLIVEYNDIVGKLLFSIPKGDFLLSISKNPFFTFIVFLSLLVSISFLFRLFSHTRNRVYKNK